MTIKLKKKYLAYADDSHARNKPVKGGRGGSSMRAGNAGKRLVKQGNMHVIGLSGRATSLHKKHGR